MSVINKSINTRAAELQRVPSRAHDWPELLPPSKAAGEAGDLCAQGDT